MTKGIRVAHDGRSAARGQAKDLAFTSENQSLKISPDFRDIVRTIDIPGAGSALVTIRHDLFYKPVFRLFVEGTPGSGIWYNDSNSLDNLDSATTLQWSIVDVNLFTITVIFVAPAACTVRYKYWLFRDSLE